ncbi:MAG: MFS transporter, partial [Candidatus Bathyarchaeia archaeon]
GVVLGLQETIQRAAVADLTSVEVRGSAYGIFNAAYGLAWLAGGSLVGILYDLNFTLIIFYSVLLQVVASLLIASLIKGTSGMGKL